MDNDTAQPVSNAQQYAALSPIALLENDFKPAFDRLPRLAAKLLHTPIAFVSLLDAEHQFFISGLGVPPSWAATQDRALTYTICQHIIASTTPLIVGDVRLQPFIDTDPALAGLGGMAYAGIPLTACGGHVLGALCVVDMTPRAWTADEIDTLQDLASLVVTEIELRMDMAARVYIEARLAMQYDVTRVLVAAEGLADATSAILQIIGKTLGWEVGILWIVDAQAEVVQCQHVWKIAVDKAMEFETTSRAMTFPRGQGLPGRVWASGQATWIGDVLTDTNFPRLAIAAQEGLHSAFSFPVRGSSGIVGVVEFFSTEIRPPDDDLLAMVAALGHQVGQFIERQQAQAELRDSEARKAAILEAALDCIISIDHTGCITEFNPAAERTFGYAREQVMGQEMAALIIPAHLRAPHRHGLAHYLATGEGPVLGKRIELVAIRADGTEFPIELAITRIPLEGPPRFTGYIRDTTEQKRAEQERLALFQREQVARSEAEQAVRARDEFLSIAAHELKTPITALRGYAELLQRRLALEDIGATRTTRVLHVIQQQSQRLTRLIEQLLDVSRLTTGRFALACEPVDICQLVQRMVEGVEPTLERHTLTVRCEAEQLVVNGDELRLEQVVQNLLDNAVKYSPAGGTIGIWIRREGQVAEVTITDQGIGIPERAQAHLFQRFYRADNVDYSQISGFGIGLYVVHEIVTRHGGTITVQSVEGAGSTFVIQLPLHETEADKSGSKQT